VTPRKKSVGDKHCLSWPGLSSDIDVGALSLQLSSPDGAKLLKFKMSPTVSHFRGSEPQVYFNYPVSLYVIGKGYKYSFIC